ncbi:hypothetical protein GCM10027026_03180 [Myroides odoratimimus subsp. xuanwuensis]
MRAQTDIGRSLEQGSSDTCTQVKQDGVIACRKLSQAGCSDVDRASVGRNDAEHLQNGQLDGSMSPTGRRPSGMSRTRRRGQKGGKQDEHLERSPDKKGQPPVSWGDSIPSWSGTDFVVWLHDNRWSDTWQAPSAEQETKVPI